MTQVFKGARAAGPDSDYWKMSGTLSTKKQAHSPFLVITPEGVLITRFLDEVLALPDDYEVMRQWRGEWSSDCFTFTVGHLRQASTRFNAYGQPIDTPI